MDRHYREKDEADTHGHCPAGIWKRSNHRGITGVWADSDLAVVAVINNVIGVEPLMIAAIPLSFGLSHIRAGGKRFRNQVLNR